MIRLFMLFAALGMFIMNTFSQDLPAAGELVITEIMTNPQSVSDTKGEWFEIKNLTDRTILLSGVVLKDLGSNHHVIGSDEPVTIAPGAYFVIGRESDPSLNGGFTPDYSSSGFSLGNTEDEIILCLEDGTIIDEVEYTDGWPLNSGVSMELRPDNLTAKDNDNPVHWFLATQSFGDGDLGTPGSGPSSTGTELLPNDLMTVALFPNPCYGRFMLEVQFPGKAKGTVRLTNILGQSIIEDPFEQSGTLRRVYEPYTMEQGLYFLEVITQTEHSVTRLVVK